MVKAIKKQGIIFFFAKLILLFSVSYLLYWQISKISINTWKQLEIIHPSLIASSAILVFLNWYLEWRKWKLTITIIEAKASQKTNVLAFLAGIATGLVTPNMLGNFIGRMYYYGRNLRPSIILLTLLSNYSQFMASIFFGFLSLLFLRESPLGIDNILLGLILFLFTFCIVFFYFFFEKIKIPYLERKNAYSKMIKLVKKNNQFRLRLLGLSVARHFVFTFQFWLMFNAFEDALNFETFFWIWQIFLWTTLIPSLWFGKLIIRESIAIFVLAGIGYGQVSILTTSISIWLINLAIPALFGIIICKQNNKVD